MANTYRADVPVASFIGFFLSELVWNARADDTDHERLARRADVLGVLVSSKLGPALQSFWKAVDPEKGEPERFPFPKLSFPNTSDYRVILAEFGAPLADKLFPERSWAWILLREAAFNARGQGKYTEDEVQYLLSSKEIGPFGCAVIAEVMGYVKSDQLRHKFATLGLERLNREDMRRDLALFTRGDNSAPKLIAAVVDLFRGLKGDEIAAICDLFEQPKLSKQIQTFHMIFSFDSRPSNELINSRVETFWDVVLKAKLEKTLRRNLVSTTSRDKPIQR